MRLRVWQVHLVAQIEQLVHYHPIFWPSQVLFQFQASAPAKDNVSTSAANHEVVDRVQSGHWELRVSKVLVFQLPHGLSQSSWHVLVVLIWILWIREHATHSNCLPFSLQSGNFSHNHEVVLAKRSCIVPHLRGKVGSEVLCDMLRRIQSIGIHVRVAHPELHEVCVDLLKVWISCVVIKHAITEVAKDRSWTLVRHLLVLALATSSEELLLPEGWEEVLPKPQRPLPLVASIHPSPMRLIHCPGTFDVLGPFDVACLRITQVVHNNIKDESDAVVVTFSH
mmetsp:Transcript_47579/g.110953  ORF Transcript_47579/g.110953 Transcript_47579/m.110953 type:complete len:281 (-) Transcript_47579:664-1506(-)